MTGRRRRPGDLRTAATGSGRRAALTRAALALAVLLAACRGGSDAAAPLTGADPATGPTAPSTGGDQASGGRFLAAGAVVARVGVYTRPGDPAPALTLSHPNPEGAPLTFAVLDARDGWLQVRLPVRPNGSTGWIRATDVALTRHSFRIEVRLAERVLTVFDGDDVVQAEPIGVGARPTPTPGGEYYLYELVRPADPNGPYGPYAFGLSGFADVLDGFNGGDGRLGLHGTDDPASLGTDSTNGCIRLANPAIDQLARTVPLGTPITIVA